MWVVIYYYLGEDDKGAICYIDTKDAICTLCIFCTYKQ